MLLEEREGYRRYVFSLSSEADSYHILVDTGLHSESVLQNVHDLNIDLSNVPLTCSSPPAQCPG